MTPACPITATQDALTLLRSGRAAMAQRVLEGLPALNVFEEDVGDSLAGDLRRAAQLRHVGFPVQGSDTGDYVVVVNAATLRVTGRKSERKLYYRHSGYPGGLKTTNFAKLQATRPERAPRRLAHSSASGSCHASPCSSALPRTIARYSSCEQAWTPSESPKRSASAS